MFDRGSDESEAFNFRVGPQAGCGLIARVSYLPGESVQFDGFNGPPGFPGRGISELREANTLTFSLTVPDRLSDCYQSQLVQPLYLR